MARPSAAGPHRTAPPIRPRVMDAKTYERALRKNILNPFVKTVEARVRVAELNYEAIRDAIRRIPTSTPVLSAQSQAAASAQMARLKKYHTDRFAGVMQRALGVKFGLLDDAVLAPIIERGIQTNVALIKTIPARYHARLVQDLSQIAADTPYDQELTRKILKDAYGSAGYNLRRLTRDQTGKVMGQFAKARQEQVGIVEYEWDSSGDQRVRPLHQANNGLVFRWDTPPGTGHPGEEILCRCVALPVIPLRSKKEVDRYIKTRM